MFRLGCDEYVYKWKPGVRGNKWRKLSEKKGWWISASKDALWMIDSESRMPLKYVEKSFK